MKRLWPSAALLCVACAGEWGLLIEIDKSSGVAELDSIRVRVDHPDTTTEKVFPLGGKALPQTVSVVSRGIAGDATVTVEGLNPGRRILARARTVATLTANQRVSVKLKLEPFCASGGTCCTPKTCEPGACGTVDDGCGATLTCTCPTGLTCGGGDAGPDRCGMGPCSPLTACPSEFNCGTRSNNCGGSVSCGGPCPSGQTCGVGPDGGAAPNVCGCARLTTCPPGVCGQIPDRCGGTLACSPCGSGQRCVLDGGSGLCCSPRTTCDAGFTCGTASDGCGGSISCGPGCTPPATCGGGPNGHPNVCGCNPQCAGARCGAPDGCGTACQTGTCDAGLACSAGLCCSVYGEKNCGGACVSVYDNPTHCGECGRTCSSGSVCLGTECSCRTVAENADGHCCPRGFTLRPAHGSGQLLCFSDLVDAGSHTEALAQCRALTAAGWDGGAVSAVGAGRSPVAQFALPSGSCGSVWQSGLGTSVVRANAAVGGEAAVACSPVCNGPSCICSTTCGQCTAVTSPALGCTAQPYHCVIEPLGATAVSCFDDTSCPPGVTCFAIMGPGACFWLFRARPCVVDSDCARRPDGGPGVCNSRNGGTLTGSCDSF